MMFILVANHLDFRKTTSNITYLMHQFLMISLSLTGPGDNDEKLVSCSDEMVQLNNPAVTRVLTSKLH